MALALAFQSSIQSSFKNEGLTKVYPSSPLAPYFKSTTEQGGSRPLLNDLLRLYHRLKYLLEKDRSNFLDERARKFNYSKFNCYY